MPLLRPLLATLALSLTLPLSAATDEIYEDETPHKVEGDGEFKDYITDFLTKDKEGALFWFRLEPGATLTLDAGLSKATLRIETAGTPDNPATLRFTKEGYISYQRSPIELLRANDVQNGTLRLTCDSWTEYDETKRNASTPAWTPSSRTIDCNLTFASPLPVDSNGNAYVVDEIFTIPSGCTFRLEASSSKESQLPDIAFTDATSTLVFPKTATNTNLAEKYCDLLESSSGRFVFERNTTITPQLTFTASPTVEVSGAKLDFQKPLSAESNNPPPTFILRNGGILSGQNLPTVTIEGEGAIEGGSSLNCLTGTGTVKDIRIPDATATIGINTILVAEGKELKTSDSFTIENLQEIKGSGTLSLGEVYQNGEPSEWKALDAILRKGGFTGAFRYTSTTMYNDIDFTNIEERTFDYTLMPYIPSGLDYSTTDFTIQMRLEQYVNLKITWPLINHPHIILKLIESESFNGKATVPAFPNDIKQFTFLRADGQTKIENYTLLRKDNNTIDLTWDPALPAFAGLPNGLNQKLIAELPKGKTPGKVIGKTPEETTKALECFSGIYEFVESEEESSTESSTAMDLRVDYDFGISRLTFVDDCKNVLVEVSLTSNASPSPTILGKITLSANGHALEDVTELSSEEVSARKLTAPEGKAVRWFRVPYDSLPEAEDLTAITVTANPPPQAN